MSIEYQQELNFTNTQGNELKRIKVPCPNCDHEDSEFACWFCKGFITGDYNIMFGQMSLGQQSDWLAGRDIREFSYS